MGLIENIASGLNKNKKEVMRFLVSAPRRYKIYTIPKRTSGYRVIAQPTKELKKYQKYIINNFTFPIHEAAMAYKKNFSIKDNALAHCRNSYHLKIDLENFFNSINHIVFWKVWSNFFLLPSEEDKAALESILFWCPSKISNSKKILSIGAPSSPTISNFIMYEFDEKIFNICNTMGIEYTRYADDMSFSTNKKNILFSLPEIINNELLSIYQGALRINKLKTIFSSKAHNRHVTGVVIDNTGKISIGRDRKRYIKHLVHKFSTSQVNAEEISHLRGLLSFSRHIEPKFIESLSKKYSHDTICQLMGGHNGK